MSPAIRPATAADLPAILALLAELAADDPPMLPGKAEALWATIAATPGMTVWLVEVEGRPVGTYTSFIMPNLGHHGAPLMIVESVVVAADQRGGGIGAAMMRHAMAQAEAAGCYKLALSSNLRRTDAHRFYRRLGFTQHGISLAVEPPRSGA